MNIPTIPTSWWKYLHGVLTFFWMFMMPVAIVTGWWQSVAFIAVISIYANFAGEFSAWQASRAEEKIEEQK